MSTLFILLLLLSIISLIVGLIRPNIFERLTKRQVNRKMVGLIFGGAIFLFFVLAGITAPPVEKTKNVADESQQKTVDTEQVEEKTNEEILEEFKQKEQQGQDTFLVEAVIDGDTIILEGGARVRYIGINTPETVHPNKPVECFGKEASAKNRELVDGKNVRLEKDVSEVDQFGRLLRYVYVGDTFVNDFLVRQGYAQVSTHPPDVNYADQFVEAQREARENNRGLWAGCDEDEAESTTQQEEQPIEESTQTEDSPYSNNDYICSYNAYNCPDFSTHAEAQYVYKKCGGVSNDVHRLDRDKDGSACETLP